MDILELRQFLAVADRLSFSRAAEHLGVSQPVLSRRIQQLEADLNVKLFDRLGRRITLTPAGAELRRHAHDLCLQVESVRQRLDEFAAGTRGTLRLGATPHTLETFVSRLLIRYRRFRPEVDIQLVEDGAATLELHVQRGTLDLAIASPLSYAGFAARLLFPLGLIAVVPAGHRLARRKVLEVSDVQEEPLLLLRDNFVSRRLFDGACQVARVSPRRVLESGSAHCLLALVAAGHGVAIVPSTIPLANHRRHVLRLVHDQLQLGAWMSVIWNPRRYTPQATRLLIEEAVKLASRDYPGRFLRLDRLIERPVVS